MDKSKNIKNVPQQVVIDGNNLIAGRLSSRAAKLLLSGKNVTIINCEKIMLSGNRNSIIREYKEYLKISSIINPKHGPFHSRRSDTIMKKMIRGMLPKNKASGKKSLKRLRTYVGSPTHTKKIKKIKLDKTETTKPIMNYTSMLELGKNIGQP